MDAKEYVDLLNDEHAILTLAHFDGDKCDGRGKAVVIDEDHQIAVMLGDCGDPDTTKVAAGAIVKFIKHPEAEPKIVGSPAYVHPTVIGGTKLR